MIQDFSKWKMIANSQNKIKSKLTLHLIAKATFLRTEKSY